MHSVFSKHLTLQYRMGVDLVHVDDDLLCNATGGVFDEEARLEIHAAADNDICRPDCVCLLCALYVHGQPLGYRHGLGPRRPQYGAWFQ